MVVGDDNGAECLVGAKGAHGKEALEELVLFKGVWTIVFIVGSSDIAKAEGVRKVVAVVLGRVLGGVVLLVEGPAA